MMSFDTHLFISYSHIDNQPLTPEQRGWITRFHDSLAALLSMRLGRRAEIWRDNKLSGNDVFEQQIVDRFSRTAVFVSVLTPRYLASDWCTREVREFCAKALQTGGVVVDHKSRIFKVLKTPIDTQESLPEVVRQLLGYEFFVYDEGVPLELDPAYGERFAQDLNRKVGKLAWDVAQVLKQIDAPESPARAAQASAGTVYLAECGHDRRDARERLEADLRLHGYSVLPEERLPIEDEAGYVAAVERLLGQSQISVHLVGRALGAVPDGPSQKSIVVLQNELAARRSRDAGLARVIWLPAGTRSDHPLQQAFIDALESDAEAQRGADVVTGEIEELKAAVHALLRKTEAARAAAPQAAVTAGGRLVHLLCDERDRKSTVPLRRFLKDAGLDVSLPAFEGSAAALREANQTLLNACDAVVIFYGAGDEAWKRTTDSELKKLKGIRSGAPPLCFTYLAEPSTGDKQDLVDLGEADVLDGRTAFPEADLGRLVAAVRSRGDRR